MMIVGCVFVEDMVDGEKLCDGRRSGGTDGKICTRHKYPAAPICSLRPARTCRHRSVSWGLVNSENKSKLDAFQMNMLNSLFLRVARALFLFRLECILVGL